MELKTVSVEKIYSKGNLRCDLPLIDELAQSIESVGLQQPIQVYAEGDQYVVWDGHRRLEAIKYTLKWPEIDVLVGEPIKDDQDLTIRQLTSGNGMPLSPVEESIALQKLIDKGMNQPDIARMLGKSQVWVSNKLQLNTLEEGLKTKVAKGTISQAAALIIKERPDLSTKAEGKSVADVKNLLKNSPTRLTTAENGYTLVGDPGNGSVTKQKPERLTLEDLVLSELRVALLGYNIPEEHLKTTMKRILKIIGGFPQG